MQCKGVSAKGKEGESETKNGGNRREWRVKVRGEGEGEIYGPPKSMKTPITQNINQNFYQNIIQNIIQNIN